ncbi:hypothetical protein HO942_10625, partial [Streptococcus suis]|nr:hypothetical protein [Streptococcus suis]
NLPGAEGERPDSNPLGGRRETNLPGAEGVSRRPPNGLMPSGLLSGRSPSAPGKLVSRRPPNGLLSGR